MAKDKIIGAVIMIGALVVLLVYTLMGPIDLACDGILSGTAIDTATVGIRHIMGLDWRWMVMLPLWIAVALVCIIAMWIGFSMITTPPPVPLEELEEELEAEEASSA
ncbi:MAG: hypothetical protein GY870_08345 [archaeon]|nr:hypothetical protein [archaeon]